MLHCDFAMFTKGAIGGMHGGKLPPRPWVWVATREKELMGQSRKSYLSYLPF